jgi:hypothetical protein
VIGEEAVDVYNRFTWATAGERFWRNLMPFAIQERTLYTNAMWFFSRNQENGESIDHYDLKTVLDP